MDCTSRLPSLCHDPSPRVLDRAGVAALLGISARHLDDVRRHDATFPRPRMVGSLARWHCDVVLDWVREASLGSSTDAGARPHAEGDGVVSSTASNPGSTPCPLPPPHRDVSDLLTATAEEASPSAPVDDVNGRVRRAGTDGTVQARSERRSRARV